MTHLLSLLERDHEDDLLSVHNFLWDRMRAVRMDLRMQHIFGEDSITMHEQMVSVNPRGLHLQILQYTLSLFIMTSFIAHPRECTKSLPGCTDR